MVRYSIISSSLYSGEVKRDGSNGMSLFFLSKKGRKRFHRDVVPPVLQGLPFFFLFFFFSLYGPMLAWVVEFTFPQDHTRILIKQDPGKLRYQVLCSSSHHRIIQLLRT
jgi:hypothetical protein